jgi:hypothetical protein
MLCTRESEGYQIDELHCDGDGRIAEAWVHRQMTREERDAALGESACREPEGLNLQSIKKLDPSKASEISAKMTTTLTDWAACWSVADQPDTELINKTLAKGFNQASPRRLWSAASWNRRAFN